MNYRKYNSKKDKKAVLRIWREVGWIERDINKQKEKTIFKFIEAGQAFVKDIRDTAECLVLTTPGSIQYLNEKLTLCAVTSVTTSRIARKQNFASQLTSCALAEAASENIAVAGLGIFDQGFYNKLGFGNGAYENWISFDPSSLKLETNKRIPFRITIKDYKSAHKSRLNRIHTHGCCDLDSDVITHLEMIETKNGFGLGFNNDDNELTHHFWIQAEGEHGPYDVRWFSFQNYEQFLELMSVLKGLGDQVYTIKMKEPPGIQFQDLLNQPFRNRNMTEKTKYENNMWSLSYCQFRIISLFDCITKTHLSKQGSHFNLSLRDPITDYLHDNQNWTGISGDYIIKFGPVSEIEYGNNKDFPTLKASVGAFTRMWLGVQSAASLSVTDDLKGPQELLRELDDLFRLPGPKPDWDF